MLEKRRPGESTQPPSEYWFKTPYGTTAVEKQNDGQVGGTGLRNATTNTDTATQAASAIFG